MGLPLRHFHNFCQSRSLGPLSEPVRAVNLNSGFGASSGSVLGHWPGKTRRFRRPSDAESSALGVRRLKAEIYERILELDISARAPASRFAERGQQAIE